MKKNKIIICLASILCLANFGYSKDSYYYYKGDRIPLKLSDDSMNVYTSQHEICKGEIQVTYSSNIISKDMRTIESDSTISSVEYVILGDDGKNVKMSNRFYVQLFDSVNDIEKLYAVAKETNTIILGSMPHMSDWYILVVDNSIFDNSLEMSNFFYETGLFKNIDPGFVFNFSSSSACVNDSYFYTYQWGLQEINACEAWTITKGEPNIKIAIIDKEIYQNHQEFYPTPTNKFLYTHNCMQTPSPAINSPWHGSMACGVILANHNNFQIAGIAPNCKIIPIAHNLVNSDKISEELAEGIGWAVSHGADVINCSWGDQNGQLYTYLHSEMLESAIQNALTYGRNGKGCVVVFASGNQNATLVDYPAYMFSDIITVGAASETLNRLSFSSYGNYLDVVAPGENIYSTNHLGGYTSDSGTSYAAPRTTCFISTTSESRSNTETGSGYYRINRTKSRRLHIFNSIRSSQWYLE